jgi:hypothetical protein
MPQTQTDKLAKQLIKLCKPSRVCRPSGGGDKLAIGYVLAFGSYLTGLALSVVTDLPSSAVIVWTMAVLGLLVHLGGSAPSSARQ